MNEINAISIAALEKRVVALESMVATSLNRIEGLIRQQIQDLKSEHINEIRKRLDRLLDESQRIWDRLRELETADSRRSGISSVWIGISHLVAAAAGGLIAAAAAWVSSGRPPPHL